MKLIPTANVRTGDFIRPSESREIKEVLSVVSARSPGYKVAILRDGSQSALGHKTGFTTIYV